MKTNGVLDLLVTRLAICLLALPGTIYAAGATTQKPGLQPAEPGRRAKLDIKITITSPQAGQTWYRGCGANITWTCYTPLFDPSCVADVALWQGGNLARPLGSSVGGGQRTWDVPFDLPGGSYEIRVNNVFTQYGQPQQKPTAIPGLEGRQAFSITPSTVKIDTPKGALISGNPPQGSADTVTWSYTGCPPPLKIGLVRSGVIVKEIATGVSGSGGKGSFSWPVNVPLPPYQSDLFSYVMYIGGGSPPINLSSTPGLSVWSTSGGFSIFGYIGCNDAVNGVVTLTQDTRCKYNPSDDAKFKGELPPRAEMRLLANGYPIYGQLAGDQGLYFGYRKVVAIKGAPIFATFSNGYLQDGVLVSDQSLDWTSGRSCSWKGGTEVAFRNMSYVLKGTLAQACSLDRRVTTTSTVTETVSAGKEVQCYGDVSPPYCTW